LLLHILLLGDRFHHLERLGPELLGILSRRK
jgi:hypothetical protein